MKYYQIRECDIANGEGIGVALFVQGCHFHCKNCFNKETWDFNGGKEWTPEIEDKFIELANRPYIKRISILGGEPLADENLDGVLNLVNKIRLLCPNKTIWLYTGYDVSIVADNKIYIATEGEKNPNFENYNKRMKIVSMCDVLVEGKYMDSLKDITLKWRGSSNQLIVDVKKSLEQGKIVLYCD